MADLDQDIPVSSLFGGKIASEDEVLEGMRSLEQVLADDFHQQQNTQRQARVRLAEDLRELMGNTAAAEPLSEIITRARESAAAAAGREPPSVEPRRETQRIFVGSIGATVVPPFDYQWTWSATTAAAVVNTLGADAGKGELSFDKRALGDAESSVNARAAVGIYFRPIVANGILRIASSPSLSFDWSTFCWHSPTHSDGFVGLYVGRYTLAGGFDGTAVDLKTPLWSDDSWWYGTSGQGTNAAFPLNAQINVDSSHYYALWVWCGGQDSSGGDGFLWFSDAISRLSIQVPSITWELF